MVSQDLPELQSLAPMMRNQALMKKSPQQVQEQPVLQSVAPVMRNQVLLKKPPPQQFQEQPLLQLVAPVMRNQTVLQKNNLQQLPLVFDDEKALEDRAGSLPRNAKLSPTQEKKCSFFTDDGKSDESVFSEDFDDDSHQLPLAACDLSKTLEDEATISLPRNASLPGRECQSITDMRSSFSPSDSPSDSQQLGIPLALGHGKTLENENLSSPRYADLSAQERRFTEKSNTSNVSSSEDNRVEESPSGDAITHESVVPLMRSQALMKKTPQQLPMALDHSKAPLENEGSCSPIPSPSNADQSAQKCSITDPADESASEEGAMDHNTASLQHGIRLQEPLMGSEQQPEFQSVVPVMRNQRLMKKTPFQHQEQPVLHLEAPEAKNQTLLKKPAPKQVVHEQPLTQLVAPVMRSQKLLATKKDVQQLPLALDNGEGSCSPIFSLPSNNAKSAQECSKKPSSSGYERCSIDHHGLRSSSIVSAAGDSSDEDSVEEY